MELRRLVLLDELRHRGTIAAVAAARSYSPSSISAQLAELEREAGIALLRRTGRTLELTPAGHRLAAYAAQAIAADEKIRAELASFDDTPAGRVRITFVQTPALALLPDTLSRLATAAPHLDVEVWQRETASGLTDLMTRDVDLVVGHEYAPLPLGVNANLDRCDLLREDVLVVAHRDHPALADPGPVRIAALADSVWASGHPGTALDAALRNITARLGGYHPDIRHRGDDGLILAALAASGRAVTLLPVLLAANIADLACRPIADEPLTRTIFTAVRAATAHSPNIAAVRDALHHTATALRNPHVRALDPTSGCQR